MTKTVGEVLDMSYHRNGISGRGFWTIIFTGAPKTDEADQTFVATFFPEEEMDGSPNVEACVAVLLIGDLVDRCASNGWRGDYFHNELQTLVDEFDWDQA